MYRLIRDILGLSPAETQTSYELDPLITERTSPSKQACRNTRPSESRLFKWACLGSIVSSTLSILVFAGQSLVVTPRGGNTPTGFSLRRPSPYMNLANILEISNRTFPPITNFPQVVLQVDGHDPWRRMVEEDRGYRTSLGSVYPDDRHFLVTPKTSTIVQFRHLDYAFEDCALNFVPPAPSDDFDPSVKTEGNSHIDIWILDMSTEISRHINNSYKFAPRRHRKLTTMEFSPNDSSVIARFRCPSNQFTTFELVCSPSIGSCALDFWQNQRAVPPGGIFLTQSFTEISSVNDK